MPNPQSNHPGFLTPRDCVDLVRLQRNKILIPAAACGALAVVFALFMTRYWEGTQGLVVRDGASASSVKQPGKFADLYEMRTMPETILEIAKSQQVLSATLKKVALAESRETPAEPSDEQLDKFRKLVSMSPPNGAEFGKTEVFYLGVKDPNPERAIALVAELCRQLGSRLGELRDEQSQGLISELEKQVALATASHGQVNAKLKSLEAEIGPDLGELRLLHSATGGQSDLRQQTVEIEKETRATEERLREAEDLLVALLAAQEDPHRLVAMPSKLLSFQPTLQRLKDGLVDAQLLASRLGGKQTAEHPHVKAALESVASIRGDLYDELAVAIKGLEVEIELSRNRQGVLNKQHTGLENRLSRLAELRSEYSSRVAAVESSSSVLSHARKQLGAVRAQQVAAQSAALVTPLDAPHTGPYPVGLGRTTVVGVGVCGGLIAGLGWVFLSAVPPVSRTASDQQVSGSNQSANRSGRRGSDPLLVTPVQNLGTIPEPVPVTLATASVPEMKPTASAFDFSQFLQPQPSSSGNLHPGLKTLTPEMLVPEVPLTVSSPAACHS